MWRNLRAPDVLGPRTSTPPAAAGDSSYAGDGGKASRSRSYIAVLTVIRRGPSSSSMTPSVSYFKLRLKLSVVEEGADGPGPLDLGLRQRVRDVVRPVYYDQFLGRTPERVVQRLLRFSRSVGVLVAVDN